MTFYMEFLFYSALTIGPMLVHFIMSWISNTFNLLCNLTFKDCEIVSSHNFLCKYMYWVSDTSHVVSSLKFSSNADLTVKLTIN